MSDRDAERRHEALIQAGLTLASELSLPSVLQKIVKAACDVADARYGALGVVGHGGGIEQFITHGVTEEERRAIGHIPEGKGILGVLITDAEPLRLRHIADDPRSVGFPANHPPMTSFLGVPVRIGDRVYGNLYLTEKRGVEEFSDQDERAVITLAAQAAVAIENARLYEDARRRQERLQASIEVTGAILEGGSIEAVLSLICRSARELLQADLATIAVPTEDGMLGLRAAAGRHADALAGTTFPAEGSVSGEVMASRRAIILEDAASDHRIDQPIVRLGDMGPSLYVALAAGDRVWGTLSVANRGGGARFTDDDILTAEAFAGQAAVALDYARLREDLQRLAILEDRERIAQELHDGVVQTLFAVGMSLQATESVADQEEKVRDRLRDSVGTIDGVIRDLRDYIFGLGSGGAADQELDRALHDLADEFRRGSDVAIRVEVDPEAASYLASAASHVLQAAREAMSNALRHGRPETLSLSLVRIGEEIMLQVEDDGRGFAPDDVRGGGRGLGNLRARAEALGGRLEIRSGTGEGTTIQIRVER